MNVNFKNYYYIFSTTLQEIEMSLKLKGETHGFAFYIRTQKYYTPFFAVSRASASSLSVFVTLT